MVGMPSDGSFQVCVLLWPHPGRDDALSAYEDAVLALLPDHGMRLVTRVRRTATAAADPLEVQVIEVPSRAALDAYMADPRRTAMTTERDAAVARTDVFEVTARTGATA